jgi:hypothetical protein
LKDVETVTNIQGGVGNPQSEYTGLGFNIYATNETSPFAVRKTFCIAVREDGIKSLVERICINPTAEPFRAAKLS